MKIFNELFKLKIKNNNGRKASLGICAVFVITLLSFAPAFAAPTGMEILNTASNKIKQANNAQANAAITVWDDKGKVNLQNDTIVKIDFKNKISRIDVGSGTALYRGMILVIDNLKNEAFMYYQVANIYYKGTISRVLGNGDSTVSQLINYDISRYLMYDTSALSSAKFLREEVINRVNYYVVEMRTKDSPTTYQLVWIDSNTYDVYKVESYLASNNSKTFQVVLTNFKTNVTDITPAKLKEMPKGAREVKA